MEILRWEQDQLVILDQTLLPGMVSYLHCPDYQTVAEAITHLRIRGAPAIGLAGAYGYALAAFNYHPKTRSEIEQQETLQQLPLHQPLAVDQLSVPGMEQQLDQAYSKLLATRPTAVNLRWALERCRQRYEWLRSKPLPEIRAGLLAEANLILDETRAQDQAISQAGAELVPDKARILTICNAGALATGGIGTALGVIRVAHRMGKQIQVYVPETRPVLQGARLTAWELDQEGIPFTLITDSMAGYLFARGEIDLVVVGADRIVANGDFANKIGSYTLAVLAAYHRVPYYVAAPTTTFDLRLERGEQIPVEQRDPEEVRSIRGQAITVAGCQVLNPSFDITPHQLVTAFITERGVLRPPFDQGITTCFSRERGVADDQR